MHLSRSAHRRTTLGLAVLVLGLVSIGAPASAAEYEIDTVHSSALFKIKHFDVAYFYGAFRDFTGTVNYDAANPAASSIDITIKSGSVDSRNSNRDDHIKSPDFLNAKQFPNITFKSTKVTPKGEDLQITGDLTLLGVKKEITLTATKTGQGTNPRSQKEMVGFETMFTVDRTQHDMNFMVGPLGQEVTLILSIEAAKK